MKINEEIITTFMDKILPFVRQPNNSEENIRLYLNFELKKFYLNAFAAGQLNVLEQTKEPEEVNDTENELAKIADESEHNW